LLTKILPVHGRYNLLYRVAVVAHTRNTYCSTQAAESMGFSWVFSSKHDDSPSRKKMRVAYIRDHEMFTAHGNL